MKELTFTKVGESMFQRFYKLSTPVSKAPNPNFNWDDERDYFLKRIEDEYKQALPREIEYVCVSDAITHIERLLFAAIPHETFDIGYSCLVGMHLDGKHTMMIDGGDDRDVHPDEVYLRRLARSNNLHFAGVK